jgi:hypothetical protein
MKYHIRKLEGTGMVAAVISVLAVVAAGYVASVFIVAMVDMEDLS